MKRKLSILLSFLMLAVMLPAGTALAADSPEVKVGTTTLVNGINDGNNVPGATGSAELDIAANKLTLSDFKTTDDLDVDVKDNDFTVVVKGDCSFGRIVVKDSKVVGLIYKTITFKGEGSEAKLSCVSTSNMDAALNATSLDMELDAIELSAKGADGTSAGGAGISLNGLTIRSGTVLGTGGNAANDEGAGGYGMSIGKLTIHDGIVSGMGGHVGQDQGDPDLDKGAGGRGISAELFTIHGGTVSGTGGNAGDSEDASGGAGIFANGNITINNGTVTGVGGSGYVHGRGIWSLAVLTMNGGRINADGRWGIYAGRTYIHGGDVAATSKPSADPDKTHAAIHTVFDLTIDGGNLTLTSDEFVMYVGGQLTIGGWFAAKPISFTMPNSKTAIAQSATKPSINQSFTFNGQAGDCAIVQDAANGWALTFSEAKQDGGNTGNGNTDGGNTGNTDGNGASKDATGWQQNLDGTWQYINPDGSKATDWEKLGNKWYYFSSEGVMYTGYWQLDGAWQEFKPSGAWVAKRSNTGWQKFSKGWSFKANGKWVYGWKEINGKWYFFDSSGYMKTGWHKSGGNWYYLKPSGAMAKGWAKAGKWYYLDNKSGAMRKGWIKDGEVDYHLSASGAMSANKWVKRGGQWYWLKSSGQMATHQWVKSGGNLYWVTESGDMITSDTIIDGKVNCFDPSGKWLGLE